MNVSPFTLIQHDKEERRIRSLREDEVKMVGGGIAANAFGPTIESTLDCSGDLGDPCKFDVDKSA